MVASYLRFAVGVCALAVALLLGGAGGTVAVADPDSSGSAAHGDDGINASGHQHSTGAKKPKDEPGATTSGTGATTSGTGAATSGTGATVTNVVAAVPGLAASVTNAVAPAPNLVGPVSDVNALIQDMLPSVAGAGARTGHATAVRACLLLVRHHRGGAGSGRRGTYRQCCAVGVRAGVGGVGIAAAAGICRYPGYAGGRHRNRGCTAWGDCGVHFRRDDPGR